MKTKELIKKIHLLALSFLLVLILMDSCKKDPINNPVPPGPTPIATPTVFTDKPLRILSEDEMASQSEFPVHIIQQIGQGLAGGEEPGFENPFKEVGEIIWEIYDYEHTEHQFEKVNEGLTNLKNQITTLGETMTNMGQHLNIQIDNLTAYISSGDLNTQIGYVKTAMGSATEDELMYYSTIAAAWEADSLNPARIAQMNALKAYIPTYASAVYHNQSSNSMINVIQAMNEDLCPTLGTGNNALLAYTKTLAALCQGKIIDSTDAMSAYLLLESYFLTVVNYQLQAATVMVNACNVMDSTGTLGYDTTFWNNNVAPLLIMEVGTFMSAVDYLVVNLGEYRSLDRLAHDMQYANAGLVPDDIFIHALARSQFIANLIYDALDLPYPVMCGTILVPFNYPDDPHGTLGITIGSEGLYFPSTQMISQLPYTYWDADNTCHPDQTWSLFKIGTLGTPDISWPTGNLGIIIGNILSSDPTTPWMHYVPITGSVTVLYYNPRNPSQTSLTKTDECTIEFAYFSAKWQWGNLLLSNSLTDNGWKKTTDGGAFDFESFNSSLVGNTFGVPFAAIGKKHNMDYQAITFSYANNTTGNMNAWGFQNETSDYYVIVDGNWIGVKTGSELPPVGGYLQGWAAYNVQYDMQGSGGVDLTVNIGTTRPMEHHNEWTGDEYYTVGGEVVRTNFHDLVGVLNTGTGHSENLNTNASYEPGVQYYYQTADLKTQVHVNICLNQIYQFVYGGYYNLP
jgi:hypothetical protein